MIELEKHPQVSREKKGRRNKRKYINGNNNQSKTPSFCYRHWSSRYDLWKRRKKKEFYHDCHFTYTRIDIYRINISKIILARERNK